MRAMLFGEMLYDGKLCFNTFAWGWSPFLKQCLRHMSDTNYGVLRTDCGLRTADFLCTIGYQGISGSRQRLSTTVRSR